MKQKTKKKLVTFKNDLGKKADVFRKEAKKNLEKAKQDLKKAEQKTKEYMKENPIKAAAIAAGIGLVVGAGVAAVIGKKKKK